MAKKKLPPLDQLMVVKDIRELVLEGYRTRDIYKFTLSKYDLSSRQTDRYLKQAREDFMQIDKKTKGQLRAIYRERLEKQYNHALTVKKDMRLALEYQKELNKLLNLYQDEEAPQETNIKVVFAQQSEDKDE